MLTGVKRVASSEKRDGIWLHVRKPGSATHSRAKEGKRGGEGTWRGLKLACTINSRKGDLELGGNGKKGNDQEWKGKIVGHQRH